MSGEEKKYEEIIKLLRKSSPEFHDQEEMEENVMKIIEGSRQKANQSETFFDYLFWWADIGWVRKSLVFASILIVVIFGYQQTVMLKRLSNLNNQPVITGNQMVTYSSLKLRDDYLFLSGYENLNLKNLKTTDKRVKKLVKSYNELREKYKELEKLIDEDPELKKFIEENFYNGNENKIKL